MTLQSVKEHLVQKNPEIKVLQFESSSATVEQAAEVLGVEPARIAKTLSFKVGDNAVLVVAAGDAKVDNGKFKRFFGTKAKMLSAEEVVYYTSHPIGGVCPFGLPFPLKVYLDISMKRFETIFPAAGTANSAVELTCNQLESYIEEVEWVDVCKAWQEEVEFADSI